MEGDEGAVLLSRDQVGRESGGRESETGKASMQDTPPTVQLPQSSQPCGAETIIIIPILLL